MGPKLSPVALVGLEIEVEKAIRTVAQDCGGEHAKKGGYYRINFFPAWNAKFYEMIEFVGSWGGGTLNYISWNKYKNLSMEKAHRLGRHVAAGHVSSYTADRNPEEFRYGGAVLLSCQIPGYGRGPALIIWSMSGLPEQGDETAMLLAAKNMTAKDEWPWRISEEDFCKVVAASKNEQAVRLLQLETPF